MSSARADSGPVSEFEGPSFRLALPGEWSSVPPNEPGLWQYRLSEGEVQLSLSVAIANPPLEPSETREVLRSIISTRREALSEALPGCALSDTREGEAPDALLASFTVTSADESLRVSSFIIVRSDLHAVVMLEGFSLSAQEFEALFKRVTAGVGLKKPAA